MTNDYESTTYYDKLLLAAQREDESLKSWYERVYEILKSILRLECSKDNPGEIKKYTSLAIMIFINKLHCSRLRMLLGSHHSPPTLYDQVYEWAAKSQAHVEEDQALNNKPMLCGQVKALTQQFQAQADPAMPSTLTPHELIPAEEQNSDALVVARVEPLQPIPAVQSNNPQVVMSSIADALNRLLEQSKALLDHNARREYDEDHNYFGQSNYSGYNVDYPEYSNSSWNQGQSYYYEESGDYYSSPNPLN